MLNLMGEVTRRAGQAQSQSTAGRSLPTPNSQATSQASTSPSVTMPTPAHATSTTQSQTQSLSAPVSAPASASRRANKACTNCARIKCKCIPRVDVPGYGCERCHRLGKTCEPSVTTTTATPRKVRAAAAPRPRMSTSRSARLEAKLNDLVDLLRNTHAAPQAEATAGATAPATTAPEEDDDASSSSSGDDDSPQSAATGGAATTTVTDPSTLPDVDDPTADTSPEDLLPHEAEACLRRFTEDMLPLAPFVSLSGPDVTVRRLRRQYPFLWRCIKAAACIHPAHRIRAASQARSAIVRRVVEQGERSLDALLGLLTFVTWVHLSTKDRFHRNFATVVAQLAVCVAWDLGLTMPPLLEPSTQAQRFVPVVQIPGIPASMWKTQRTMEERRAVLGVYLVTSATSQMFRSADGLRWSPYLEQVLGEVQSQNSDPQDKTLVRHVKIQLLINQVRYASTGGHGGMTGSGSGVAGGSMYRSFGSGPTQLPGPYMDSLRAQLDDIVGVVDGTSPAFENFTTHNLYHFAILAIHESVLARKPQTGGTGMPGQAGSGPGIGWLPDLQRFEIYQRCLTSVHAWLERLFAWPLSFYVCLPSGTYLQMFYVLVCLHKLTTLKDPAWNVEAVRGVMDLFPTMDRILDMCHELRAMMAAQLEGTAVAAGGRPSANTGPAAAGPGNTPTSGIGTASASTTSVIEEDDQDPILVAIRKFSTLKVIWQNEMVAQERERQEAAAAHATGPLLVDGQPVADSVGLDTPMVGATDFFSNYSLDVLNYFHAMPDVTDLSWP
ncbi:hypothetical protein SEUCBS140593_008265 [Sporothrix eucalyptigena]|uniref:Zn(2)-C6 fungal-type domain-containing protein n=1 Tax=Sporothrix eucalyptigena TaxID=1812306 RepID=A0ABP0CMN1_9PEZI